MRLLALLVAFIVVPLAELYVIVRVGVAIGLLPTIALLLLDSVLGTVLLRSQGRAVWRRFTAAMAEGRVPHGEILDGALVILGGALLLTPGFLTDVLGAAFLIPPSRAIARRVLARALRRRAFAGLAGASGRRGGLGGGGPLGGGGSPFGAGGSPFGDDGSPFGAGRRPSDADGRPPSDADGRPPSDADRPAYDVEGSANEVEHPDEGAEPRPPRLER